MIEGENVSSVGIRVHFARRCKCMRLCSSISIIVESKVVTLFERFLIQLDETRKKSSYNHVINIQIPR